MTSLAKISELLSRARKDIVPGHCEDLAAKRYFLQRCHDAGRANLVPIRVELCVNERNTPLAWFDIIRTPVKLEKISHPGKQVLKTVPASKYQSSDCKHFLVSKTGKGDPSPSFEGHYRSLRSRFVL